MASNGQYVTKCDDGPGQGAPDQFAVLSSESAEPDSGDRVIGFLVQDDGGPGAGGLDVLDEVDFVDGFPDLDAERVDLGRADLGKPAERRLRIGEGGIPQRVQPAEE